MVYTGFQFTRFFLSFTIERNYMNMTKLARYAMFGLIYFAA
jgi:hypothetical protein